MTSASSESSNEPAHTSRLARAFASGTSEEWNIATCADPENFVRGGPTLIFFFFFFFLWNGDQIPSSARAYACPLCYTQKKYKRHSCTGSVLNFNLEYNNNTQYRKILKCIPHIICLTQTSLQIRFGYVTHLIRKSKLLHREQQYQILVPYLCQHFPWKRSL